MPEYYKIKGETLTNIADAIREKKIGKSATMTPLEMPTEIASIESGISIEHGVKYTLDSDGIIVGAKILGDTIPPYLFNYAFYGNPKAVVIDLTGVNEIGNSGFNATDSCLVDFSTCGDVEVIGSNAFRINARAISSMADQTVYMPKLTGVGSSQQIFYGANTYMPKVYRFPKMSMIPPYMFYNIRQTDLNIEFGSLGNAVTSIAGGNTFGATTSVTGTITTYTTGEYLDAVKYIQSGAGSGLTFIYKASEATTYNGTSYNAGDTMMTSTGA